MVTEDVKTALGEMTVETAAHERTRREDGTARTISRRPMRLVAARLAMPVLTPRHHKSLLLQTSGRRQETAVPNPSHRPEGEVKGEVTTLTGWAMGGIRRLARTPQLDQWSRTMAGVGTRTRITDD